MLYKVASILALIFSTVAMCATLSHTGVAAGIGAINPFAHPRSPHATQNYPYTQVMTAANCLGAGGTAAQHAVTHTYWADKNDNTSAEVDCGGDFYSLGSANPFFQLGQPPTDVSVAGGYCLGNDATSGGAYTCMSDDHTYAIDGIPCQQIMFFYNPVSHALKKLGCFDNNGDFGVAGGVYAAGGYH